MAREEEKSWRPSWGGPFSKFLMNPDHRTGVVESRRERRRALGCRYPEGGNTGEDVKCLEAKGTL